MQDGEIQRELLKETRSAKKVLEVTINFEMGIQNQSKKSRTAILQNTNEITTTFINNVQSSWNRSRPVTNNFIKPTICPNCGNGWSAAHRLNCPARGKSCKKLRNCQSLCENV